MSSFVVLGATGHIGSAVIRTLIEAGGSAIAIAHSRESAQSIAGPAVEARVMDVMDTEALREVLKEAGRAFLLNPPADPSSDTDAREAASARCIAEAVRGSGLEKVVVASTYGAQPGEKIGDLSILYDFEQMIRATGIPCAVNRGAYYFSNLDASLESAWQGVIASPFPADLKIPMVSPHDLGRAAAVRLMSAVTDVGIRYVEGPERYTFAEVADAFSSVLSRRVELRTIPRDEIEQSFRKLGFSKEAAESYARMMKASIDGGFEVPPDPERGATSLQEHIASLVDSAPKP
ncbi:NAD-dependent epimerase/dehydratase family protein [Rhizobium tropici]|uniref:NAD-dependent epimerase/dehydratase family protein n=1 Tax=Rhizobium tropici TaxID=398 RepID=A0A5B0VQT3_RHITR|nr:NmrA family NAD(P)-binding protein [Rhizobium tropici]KAA1176648.1 NAD-dependent epimerase/dehydratase family protein [Rhizobium tropici]